MKESNPLLVVPSHGCNHYTNSLHMAGEAGVEPALPE
jgi:hypothetical protein